MSVYDELHAAGCTLSHHYSDLYVVMDAVSQPIMHRYRQRTLRQRGQPTNGRLPHVSVFVDQVNGQLTWNVFGAYDPYWERA